MISSALLLRGARAPPLRSGTAAQFLCSGSSPHAGAGPGSWLLCPQVPDTQQVRCPIITRSHAWLARSCLLNNVSPDCYYERETALKTNSQTHCPPIPHHPFPSHPTHIRARTHMHTHVRARPYAHTQMRCPVPNLGRAFCCCCRRHRFNVGWVGQVNRLSKQTTKSPRRQRRQMSRGRGWGQWNKAKGDEW